MEGDMTAMGHTTSHRNERFAYVPGVHGLKPAAAPRPVVRLRPSVADLGPLATIAAEQKFAAGAQIIMEGDPADHVFWISAGVVKVYRTLADGRCQITGFLFPGDFLGFAPDDEYVSGAVAVGAVTVSRFARKKVEQLVAASPLVARLLLRRTCCELNAAQNQMLLLGRKTAGEKIATFLMQVLDRTDSDRIVLPMTRTDIADYLGLTIETVSRTLTHLREDAVIAVQRAEIRVLDRAELEARADAA
jgi:CRP/FNR family transcriptional regulator